MYFVSKTAAAWRKIESGWYVLSEPNESFYLTVKNFHEEGRVRFRGKKIARSEITGYNVLLDGVDVRLGTVTGIEGMETEKHTGFVIELAGSIERTRSFPSDEIRNVPADLGTIVLRISRRKFGENVETFTPRQMKLPVNNRMNEKKAKKQSFMKQD